MDAASKQDADDATSALKQAQANVIAARAALQAARINLDYTRVTAPIDGRIGTSSVTAGALVAAGQDAALTTIQRLDPVYLDVTQSSTQMLALRKQLDAGLVKAIDGKAQVQVRGRSGYRQRGAARGHSEPGWPAAAGHVPEGGAADGHRCARAAGAAEGGGAQ
ncbi:hypothetical protein G6F32_015046 [Rhizopus arrhizus]|nr:hypothetical protein G6F32_015046 [Rhizopus arrhizus]